MVAARWIVNLLAIDPGNTESAYVVIDRDDRRPVQHGKIPNEDLLDLIASDGPRYRLPLYHAAAIEMVASYGMAVGAEVFDTCVWIGRFDEALRQYGRPAALVKRLAVKLHHCHDSKAKDTNIRQALVDRFTPGQPNNGKGTKANPGWFYGFHSDIWAAYALAVHAADTDLSEETP
jgi:hypothetical protein